MCIRDRWRDEQAAADETPKGEIGPAVLSLADGARPDDAKHAGEAQDTRSVDESSLVTGKPMGA
eukprot:6051662-Alexandrium_andersonii.AAC.1